VISNNFRIRGDLDEKRDKMKGTRKGMKYGYGERIETKNV
jgi:hypothetical protein